MHREILELEGSFNVRDIGGYPAGEGKTTLHRRFIRAGSLAELTERGKTALLEMGVRCVIDLRSAREVAENPDAVMDDRRFSWFHLPMLDYIHSGLAYGLPDDFPASLEEMYIGLLENSKESFRQLFEIFGASGQEGFLFHCTAGKDRTGVAAMLLLSLAGVGKDMIVEDYTQSEGQLKPIMASFSAVIPDYLCRSQAQTMRRVIEYLEGSYGSVRGYLDHIGVTPGLQSAILAKLVG